MQYWSRQDTKHWIAQLENRIEDIEYYLKRTISWCEENEVYSDRLIFACLVMTASWVSYMRQEPLSKQEIFEILKVDGWETVEDGIFEFNAEYDYLEHEELLQMIVSSF
jgi:hypothetical protein